MFLRGRQHESTVWQRFHVPSDGFTARHVDGVVEVSVRSNAERVVDLFLALIDEMSPAVSASMDDVRASSRWAGTALALPDVSETLGRLKLPLTTYAGAEISIYSPEDQLTLTPWLELYGYAVSERWVFLLRGHGLVERTSLPSRSWRLSRDGFPPAPEASKALRLAAERLGMVPS
jgi:hypothetical protein